MNGPRAKRALAWLIAEPTVAEPMRRWCVALSAILLAMPNASVTLAWVFPPEPFQLAHWDEEHGLPPGPLSGAVQTGDGVANVENRRVEVIVR